MKDPYSKKLPCHDCGQTPYDGVNEYGEICWTCGGSGIRQDDPFFSRVIGLLIGSITGLFLAVLFGLEWWFK